MPLVYGSCAQGTFGCAGFLLPGRLTCVQPPPLSFSRELVHALSVLRSANATALEASRGCGDTQRDLVFAVLHLVDMARELIDQSLNNLPAR